MRLSRSFRSLLCVLPAVMGLAVSAKATSVTLSGNYNTWAHNPTGSATLSTYSLNYQALSRSFLSYGVGNRLRAITFWAQRYENYRPTFPPGRCRIFVAPFDVVTGNVSGPPIFVGPEMTVASTHFTPYRVACDVPLATNGNYLAYISCSEFDNTTTQSITVAAYSGQVNQPASGLAQLSAGSFDPAHPWTTVSFSPVSEVVMATADNRGPTASAASFDVAYNKPSLAFNFFGNYGDAPLPHYRLSGYDPNGDRVYTIITSLPKHGTLKSTTPDNPLTPDHILTAADLPYRLQILPWLEQFVYTPDTNFSGPDSFDYTATDLDFTSSSTVSFNVAAPPPPPDVTPPILNLSGSVFSLSSLQTTRFPDLTGSASDSGSGLDKIRVSIQLPRSNRWWDGANWTTTYRELAANLDANGNWIFSMPYLSNARLLEDLYVITVKAYDRAGNIGQKQSILRINYQAPVITITTAKGTVGGNMEISGTALDLPYSTTTPSDWVFVIYSIYDNTRKQYWNGLSWGPYMTYNPLFNSSTGRWIVPYSPSDGAMTPLGNNPPSTLTVTVKAYDALHNSSEVRYSFKPTYPAALKVTKSAPAS